MFPRTIPLAMLGLLMAAGSVCNGQANETDPAGQSDPAIKAVEVSDFDTVSLNVQDADLAQVLQLLSIQGRRNIVPSPAVSGKVTANLYDVTFDEALSAILQQNGADYVEKDKFIYVYTQDELRKIQQSNRQVEHQVFRLNYITAADASTFVTPLLSTAGAISISGEVSPGFQPTMSDNGANSYAHADTMVIRDYKENIEAIRGVIKQIDVRPRQVLVEATILKADVTDETAFGVDFSILTNIAVDAFADPLSSVTELIKGDVQPSHQVGAVTSSVGNVSDGEGGLRVGVVTNNVAAFIRALDAVTDTTIVANPKVLTLNRQKADVLVGEKIGYLSTTATATATTQTVEFLDTGTQLTLRPFVSDDGMVRLELKPQISSFRIRDVVPGTETAAVTIPDEITQELTTNVMVRDGQTIVLGGLFKEKTTITRRQIPMLGDIPIAGAAFKGHDDEVERSEVIFLITPHIVKDEALYAAGQSTADAVEMVRIGAREGLLPWSRTKMSAAHLRDALEAIEEDDADTALWEVDMALFLDPKMTEALRLREKLTGGRAYWPGSSLLDDAVDLMIERTTGERQWRARPMKPGPRPAQPMSDIEPDVGAADEVTPIAEQAQAPVGQAPVEVVEVEPEPVETTSETDEPTIEVVEAEPAVEEVTPIEAEAAEEAIEAEGDDTDWGASQPLTQHQPEPETEAENVEAIVEVEPQADGAEGRIDNQQASVETETTEPGKQGLWPSVLTDAIEKHFGEQPYPVDADSTTRVEPQSPDEPY